MKRNDGWIVVPGWEGFQHPDVARNKHGIPPWIRVYTELTSKPEFIDLSLHQRGVLISIWVEYARSRSQLSARRDLLSRQLGAIVYQRDLDALNHAGFIRFSASKPQAEIQQVSSTEESREEEIQRRTKDKEPSIPPSVVQDLEKNGWMDNGLQRITEHDLPEVLRP